MKTAQHPELPYGTGTVYYEPRNAINHWIAQRFKTGTKAGRIYVGSFPTEEEAKAALADIRYKSSQELMQENLTMDELYSYMVRGLKRAHRSEATISQYRTAMNKCIDLADRPYVSITGEEMESYVFSELTSASQRLVQRLFRKLDVTAHKRGLDIRWYSDDIEKIIYTDDDFRRKRHLFKEPEVQALLRHTSEDDVYLVLVLLYTGMRPIELLQKTHDQVDLKHMMILGGAKTDSGKRRSIPIHPYIQRFFQQAMQRTDTEYVFANENGGMMRYEELSLRYKMVCAEWCAKGHTLYDTRHSFCTWLDEKDVNYNTVEYLMGHKINEYRHIEIDEERQWQAINALWKKQ
ncbi:MAG: tyrosine-type recombinase/integrase [Lachnospiraceae bacterium]|nr:tyrosine-type recombinase/integrase [Lachnospiraceae bacterium]